MMLSHKNHKAADLVGKKVRLKDAIRNRGGIEIPTGAICEIVSAHHNLTIRYCCSHCGVKADISGISRNADYLELVQDEENKSCQTCKNFVCDNFADKSCWRPKE